MTYFKAEVSDLMRHFAGSWSSSTSNRSDTITLLSNGIYSNKHVASYSAKFTDGWGTETGNWGAAGGSDNQGSRTARGTKDQGHIIVNHSNGTGTIYKYKVHIENGEKFYRNYWFNGEFYIKSIE